MNSLVGLSLNFFFILPAMNSGTLRFFNQFKEVYLMFCEINFDSFMIFGMAVGIRLIDAPVLHPVRITFKWLTSIFHRSSLNDTIVMMEFSFSSDV